ncbi:MAG: TolC family protein [Flavobacteriales bacterium]|nr:TolC family protein [Flavobacteriales bacterium]
MKLVNIHKRGLLPLLILAWGTAAGQAPLSLQQCVDTALAHNATLLIERNNAEVGQGRLQEARANRLPKLTANGDYRYYGDLPYQFMPLSTFNPMAPEGQFKEVQFGVPHNINANVQLTMPLYSPQLYGGIQGAEVAAGIQGMQVQRAAEQVVQEVTTLYYNAQVLHHQLAYLDSNRLNTEKLLRNVQLLRGQLLAKGTDVDRVELQAAQLASQHAQAESRYAQVLDALKLAMGMPLGRDLHIDTTIAFGREAQYLPATTVEHRLAQARSALLRTELGTLGRSRFLPSVGLMGSYGTMGFGYSKAPNDFLTFRTVSMAGLQVSWPLFNGTAINRQMVRKRLELRNNELQLKLLDDQQAMRRANAERLRAVALTNVANTGEQLGLARTIYEQTVLQQSQGTAALTDVLLADQALRTAQQDHLAAMVDYLKADLELKAATGNLMQTNN